MKLKPIKQYREPSYATRAILDAHPELLRLVPKRWQTNALVLTAVAATGLIVSARWLGAAGKQKAVDASHVAPIFVHGEGHGAFGCVAVNPPVFLSEDEAREVVKQEATAAGLKFIADGKVLQNIAIPLTSLNFGSKKDAPKTKKSTLALDGWDEKRNIAFVYVSEKDYRAWESDQIMSTVSSYQIQNAAKVLQAGLDEAKPAGAYGVFYDPMQGYSDAAAHLIPSKEFTAKTLAPINFLSYYGDTTKIEKHDGNITIKQGGCYLTLTIGSDQAIANGEKITLATPAIEWHSSIYAPLQTMCDTLGLQVKLDKHTSYLALDLPGKAYPTYSAIMVTEDKDPEKVLSLAFTSHDYQAREAIARDVSREELRKQVRDFIAWLKAEGVI